MLDATPHESVEDAELIVMTYHDPIFHEALSILGTDIPVIDLNSINCEPAPVNEPYGEPEARPDHRREPTRTL